MFQRALPLLLAVCCVAPLGCGRSGGLYPVKGKVLHNGAPAVGATVSFYRKGGTDRAQEHTPQGVVGEDGTFELASPAGKGAVPGEYIVLVEWKVGAGKARGRSPGLSAPDRFKGRYLNPDNPQLHALVKPTSNDLPPFELR